MTRPDDTEPSAEALEEANKWFSWPDSRDRLAYALDRFRAAGVREERAITRERIETFAFGAEGAGHIERARTARDVAQMLQLVDRVFSEPPHD